MSRSKLVIGGSIVAVVVLGASVAFAKPLSEQQWKKEGNAICKQLNKKLDGIGNEVFAGLGKNEQPSAEQVKAWVPQFTAAVQDAVASIDGLKEPAALTTDVKKLKAAVNDTLATIQADPSVLFDEKNNAFAKPDKIARKIGLKACADG